MYCDDCKQCERTYFDFLIKYLQGSVTTDLSDSDGTATIEECLSGALPNRLRDSTE